MATKLLLIPKFNNEAIACRDGCFNRNFSTNYAVQNNSQLQEYIGGYNYKFTKKELLYPAKYDFDPVITRNHDFSRKNTIGEKENKTNNKPEEHATESSKEISNTCATNIKNKSINLSEDTQGNVLNLAEEPKEKQYNNLKGVLCIETIKSQVMSDREDYYIVCPVFWKENVICLRLCANKSFNYIESFSVVNNDAFLKHVKANHIRLEVWRKMDQKDELFGLVKVPLHQFYIAFQDALLAQHLSQLETPVTSVDGWLAVNDPHTNNPLGQLQVLLAIGTEKQIQNLKLKRGLREMPGKEMYPANTVRNFGETNAVSVSVAKQERLSDILGSFLENLAQQLPNEHPQLVTKKSATNVPTKPSNENDDRKSNALQRTSDLLDTLEKALLIPTLIPPKVCDDRQSSFKEIEHKFVKIYLEINCATELPRNPLPLANKKGKKPNTGKYKQSKLSTNEEPSTYATFHAKEGPQLMIKSHEGLLYATHVVPKNSNPVWKSRFEIEVPTILFENREKPFTLKVWRKGKCNQKNEKLLPKPIEDCIIGIATVDLSVLSDHQATINDWVNLVDFNGKINGKLKINIKLLDTITSQSPYGLKRITSCDTLRQPDTDDGGMSLTRAIKRKFTELEGIRERLKARLFDVTSDSYLDDDITDEQLEEFEKDLNTACDEGDSDEQKHDFGWLGVSDTDESQGSFIEPQENIERLTKYLQRTDINDLKLSNRK